MYRASQKIIPSIFADISAVHAIFEYNFTQWLNNTRSSAIAERPRCSLFKLWQKYKREKRASGLFF